MQDVLIELIKDERIRQDLKWGVDRNLPLGEWLAILVEEVGEVARALLDSNPKNLREELVQVSAVSLAWLEAIYRMPEVIE